MDSPEHILSPSKAAEAISLSRSWTSIKSFLAPLLYPNPVPPFERNEATLNAILALASHSESLTEQHTLLSETRAEALNELRELAQHDADADLLGTIEDSLTREGHQALDALTSTPTTLGGLSSDPEQMALAVVSLTRAEFDNQQQMQRVDEQRKHLERELVRIRSQFAELKGEGFQTPQDLVKQTSEWTRGTKQLSLKLREYKERVVRLEEITGGRPHIEIPELGAEEREVREMEAMVQSLEGQVKAFEDLPPDKELALMEVKRVRRDLELVTRRRDSLFEGLVEDGH